MQANPTDIDPAATDLGPLAWVLDELRKSLDTASAALRRFVRDVGLSRDSELTEVDTGQLRIARQQLHQGVGALEMVGLAAPAHMLRAMEAAVQKFVDGPALCSEASAAKLERAGYALTEYLAAVLLGKPVSAVALFPQYRDAQELAGADRIHPADLWSLDWRWTEPQTSSATVAMAYDASVRSQMDQAVLGVIKSGDAAAAGKLAQLCLALASHQTVRQPKIFWKIGAGFFEALSLGLLPTDLYVKRAASRVLMQYASLAKGELNASDRLAQDLLFFCAQAVPQHAADAPALTSVRLAYALDRFAPVDYLISQFGRFDPLLLAQARKRIGVAKELWSILSGGEIGKLKSTADQFHLVGDSLVKLYPPSAPLARALTTAIDAVAHAARPPRPELAMEVATAVLYLEAAFEDLDPTDSQLAGRMARLAERLETVHQGGAPEPLELWMEELYRRVSDRQTMGSVVGELRTTLSELEKLLDNFFRNPQDRTPLQGAPGYLSQMRGVLSVLGLDQAAHAVLRMRESVEGMAAETDQDPVHSAEVFDKLGNNLGALGFLIDMLNYQPALARKLFVYDDERGELKLLMGRAADTLPAPLAIDTAGDALLAQQVAAVVADAGRSEVADDLTDRLDALASQAALAELTGLAQTAREAAAAVLARDEAAAAAALKSLAAAVQMPAASTAVLPVTPDAAAAGDEDDEDVELRDIFLDEAREVVQSSQAAVNALSTRPADLSELTTLRRAFHTLKGSARMVGLTEFGEAAWSMEQVLNAWLGDQKPATADLCSLIGDVLRGLARWVEDIATATDSAWNANLFRGPADAMRTQQRLIALALPGVDVTFERAIAEAAIETMEEPAAETATEPVAEPLGQALADLIAQTQPAGLHHADRSAYQDPVFSIDPSLVLRAVPPAAVELATEDFSADFVFDVPGSELPPHTDAMLPVEPLIPLEAEVADEQVKVIGTLRIGIPLYNVYLNEADEWSRRLVTEVTEWAMELNQPLPDSTVGLAHALAGSSATVGFQTLSDIARTLEHALQHTQPLAYGTPRHGKVFTDAAEEIRRLLHQFAAGFLKDPDPRITPALLALTDIEVPQRADLIEDLPLSDFADLDVVALGPVHEPVPVFDFQRPPEAATIEAAAAPVVVAPIDLEPIAVAPLSTFAASTFAGLADLVAAPDDTGEEDLDIVDAMDADLFPIFEEEALELLPQMGGALRQWVARPENREARNEVLRVLHTLKGSARLAGALRLGELAHRMESEIEFLGSEHVDAVNIEPLLHRFDALQGNFDTLRVTGGQPQPTTASALPMDAPATATVEPAAAATDMLPADPAGAGLLPVAAPKHALLAMPVTTLLAPQRAAANQAVRVRSQLLDRLVNQAGEVIITRSRLEAELGQLRGSLKDLSGNLDRLRSQLRDIELQAETQMQSRLALTKDSGADFDPLEFDRFTRVQEITRMMAESVNDVATVHRSLQRTVEATEDDLIAQARQTRELQRDLLRTRMVEFESISDRLYRVVRLASKETGKQVKLDITGGSIEMDRGVLDRMLPAFEHLLRNCVAHGIETPALRDAAGKQPAGTILIGLHHEGNDVSVEFHDDGAGLDLPRIREKALQQGLIKPHQELSDPESADLIFMPGLTTAKAVTELSGRGIGMDVVRSEVNALGGRIETSTETGKGTNFKLVLPLTTAVTQVVMIRSGKLAIGVPANVVEIVRRATAKEVQQAYNSGFYEMGDVQLPFYWSGALLQASQHSAEPPARTLPVVVFKSAAQRIAMHVDEVLGTQEVVVKNLGPQLARLPGLAGMTVLASGAVVLIYNPVALTTVYGEQARRLSADPAQPEVLGAVATGAGIVFPGASALGAPPQIPLVLVVDDSITVRRVTQRLLQREGYRVALAADGLQAIERLIEERPAVVLSDIEMPRMDGFDLARNIRADARLAGLPIIMITSRIAEKHREHAMELGVNHYLGKPYSEDELLSLVKHYCSAAIAV